MRWIGDAPTLQKPFEFTGSRSRNTRWTRQISFWSLFKIPKKNGLFHVCLFKFQILFWLSKLAKLKQHPYKNINCFPLCCKFPLIFSWSCVYKKLYIYLLSANICPIITSSSLTFSRGNEGISVLFHLFSYFGQKDHLVNLISMLTTHRMQQILLC